MIEPAQRPIHVDMAEADVNVPVFDTEGGIIGYASARFEYYTKGFIPFFHITHVEYSALMDLIYPEVDDVKDAIRDYLIGNRVEEFPTEFIKL